MPICRRTLLPLAAALVLLGPAACQTAPEAPASYNVSFTHLAPLRLQVARVDIVDQYRSPMEAPYVEHTFPTPPGTALVRWVRDRISAEGLTGRARFTIHEASVVRGPAAGGRRPLLPDTERLRAKLSVSLEIRDRDGVPKGAFKVVAERARTVGAGLGLAERDKVYVSLVKDLMNDMNAGLEQNIREHFRDYLLLPLAGD